MIPSQHEREVKGVKLERPSGIIMETFRMCERIREWMKKWMGERKKRVSRLFFMLSLIRQSGEDGWQVECGRFVYFSGVRKLAIHSLSQGGFGGACLCVFARRWEWGGEHKKVISHSRRTSCTHCCWICAEVFGWSKSENLFNLHDERESSERVEDWMGIEWNVREMTQHTTLTDSRRANYFSECDGDERLNDTPINSHFNDNDDGLARREWSQKLLWFAAAGICEESRRLRFRELITGWWIQRCGRVDELLKNKIKQ